MKILSIEAQKEKLVFHLEGIENPKDLLIREQVPVKGPVSGRQLYLGNGEVCGKDLTLPGMRAPMTVCSAALLFGWERKR